MSVYGWKSRIFALVIAPLACSGSAKAPEAAGETSATPVEGAWRLVEFKLGDAPAVVNPASLYLFTARHYSVTYANTTQRATFATASAPTDAEKLLAYNTLIANSGTFEIAGDTLITRPVISRNPNFMGGGEDKFLMRTAGDTLWLTNVPGAFRLANSPPSPPTNDSFTLVRER